MSKYITVFIPVYNGEKYLRECLDSIINQALPKNFKLEILVIDSGSTDQSISILSEYGDKIEFTTIPNNEFGHGKTRQAAAERAKGEYIIFLSQDATPVNSRWIIDMIEPFFISDQVGCVFGRQIPRPRSVATIKREVAHAFAGLGAPDSLVLHRHKSLVDHKEVNALNSFFSDVNSAVKKELIVKIPFRDVAYAEDQALAIDYQNSGYLKAYSTLGAVWHSNEYTIKEYRKRKFDEYLGLINSADYSEKPSIYRLMKHWIKPTIADCKFTMKDSAYSRRYKIKNLFLSAGYNIAAQIGKHEALKFKDEPNKFKELSLEQSRKNHN